MSDHGHTTDEEYTEILKDMAKADRRTDRQLEVESAFGQTLPVALSELHEYCDTKSEMLRRINATLDANGIQGSVSRPTLYRWLKQFGITNTQDNAQED